MQDAGRVIAIIGGGFCGVALTIRLLRLSAPGTARIVIIEPLAGGWIRPDAHALGIDVAPDGRVISRDGMPVDRLHYLGPWLRARDWEATAVPELREHAARLARVLLDQGRIAGRKTAMG